MILNPVNTHLLRSSALAVWPLLLGCGSIMSTITIALPADALVAAPVAAAPFTITSAEGASAFSGEDREAVESLLDSMQISLHSVPDSSFKTHVLLELAKAYQQWGQDQSTATLLTLVETQIEGLDTPYDRAVLRAAIGRTYLAIDRTPEAIAQFNLGLAHAESIEDAEALTHLLRGLANAVADIPEPSDAIALLSAIVQASKTLPEAYPKTYVFSDILDTLATVAKDRGEEVDAAPLLVEMMATVDAMILAEPEELYRSSWINTMSRIVETLATTTGQLSADRHQTVRLLTSMTDNVYTIPEPGYRASALVAIAHAYGELGTPQQGLDVLDASLRAAIAEPKLHFRFNVLADIAATAIALGDVQQGAEVIDMGLAMYEALFAEDQVEASRVGIPFSSLVAVIGDLPDQSQALSFLNRVLGMAQEATSPWDKAFLLAELHVVGDFTPTPEVLTLVQAILAEARPLTEDELKKNALVNVAVIAQQWSDPALSQDILQQVTQATVGMEDFQFRVFNATLAAARTLSQDHPQEADALLETILAVLAQTDQITHVSVLGDVAAVYGEMGNESRQIETLTFGLDATESLADDWGTSTTLSNIAQAAVTLSDRTAAEHLLQGAIAQLPSISDEARQVTTLTAILDALATWNGTPEAMVRLMSAIDSLPPLMTNPEAKAKALVAIASAYARLAPTDPEVTPLVPNRVDQAIALIPAISDNSEVGNLLGHITRSDYPLMTQADIQRFLAQIEPTELHTVDDIRLLFQFAQHSLMLGASDSAVGAMETAIAFADDLPESLVQDTMAQLDASYLEWKYGTTDPQAQFVAFFNEKKTDMFIGMTQVIVETIPTAGPHPEWGPLLESAIATTDSITVADERFYALRAIGKAAIHTRNIPQTTIVLAEAASIFEDLAQIHDPMAYFLLEDLPLDDVQTTLAFLSPMVDTLNTSDTLSADAKLTVLWAIADHLLTMAHPPIADPDPDISIDANE